MDRKQAQEEHSNATAFASDPADSPGDLSCVAFNCSALVERCRSDAVMRTRAVGPRMAFIELPGKRPVNKARDDRLMQQGHG